MLQQPSPTVPVPTAAAHCLRRRRHHHALRQSQIHCDLRQHRAHGLVALKEPGHLGFGDTAVSKEFLAPAAVGHVQKEHPRGVGVVTAVHAGKAIDQIVLGSMIFLIFAKCSGSWRRIHKSFGAVNPAKAMLPTREKLFLPEVLVELRVSWPVRPSFQRMAGANHLILSSSATRPCICPPYGQAGYLVLVHLRERKQ